LVKRLTNINHFALSGCGLSNKSAPGIASLIGSQSMEREELSWQLNLRQETRCEGEDLYQSKGRRDLLAKGLISLNISNNLLKVPPLLRIQF